MIKVVGVGGGGTNAVNRMVDAGLGGVEFIAVNTDAQALLMADADVKIHIGSEATRAPRRRGRPCGRARGCRASRDELKEALKGADMIFVTAGEGGGTGTGGAPVVAELGRARCAHGRRRHEAVRVRGRRRAEQAEVGTQNLRDQVDTLIVIENDRLLQVVEKKTPVTEAFRIADDILRQGVQGITDLITVPGIVNLDFADVRTIMRDAGSALMGIGTASGENRAAEAARTAVSSPLLEQSVDGATGILLNVTGGTELGLFEVNEAAEVVTGAADQNANVIFGAVIDDSLGDEVRVTVIATGFGTRMRRRRVEAAVPQPVGASEQPEREHATRSSRSRPSSATADSRQEGFSFGRCGIVRPCPLGRLPGRSRRPRSEAPVRRGLVLSQPLESAPCETLLRTPLHARHVAAGRGWFRSPAGRCRPVRGRDPGASGGAQRRGRLRRLAHGPVPRRGPERARAAPGAALERSRQDRRRRGAVHAARRTSAAASSTT